MNSKAVILVLAAWPGLAMADAVAAAAHARFEQTLNEASGSAANLTPRMQRLIGWSGTTAVRSRTPAETLKWLIDESWAWSQQTSPESATFTGYPGQNGRWSSLDAESLARTQAIEAKFLQVLDSIDADDLNAAQQLDLALLRFRMRDSVASHAYPDELMPVNQMFGVQTWIPSVLGAQPLFTEADRRDFLRRLEGIPLLLTQVRAQLAAGLERGVTPPQITLQKVPQQVLDLAPEDGRDSPLLQSLQRLPKAVTAAERDAFADAALRLYREQIRPAILALHVYLRDTYLPGAVRATGLGQLPNGAAWYAHQARHYTTTDLTPQQIHDIGLREVARIREQMLAVQREVGFTGTIPAFAAKIKQDPRWFFTSEDEYLTAYRALGKRVDALLPKLFRRFAALPYGIEPVPAFRAAGSATAYYLPGSAEFGRAGIFYINTLRMPEAPKYEMEALLLHEAVPGHHFQIALAQEIGEVAEFRKHTRYTAYTEGWGLYAESLGAELGLYTDPYYQYGALTYEIWRAIRLVVDTGMHALGWSREQAITYFAENTGRSRARIEAEVDRYLVLPGQALAYMVGSLKIRELRTRAETTLGEAFDVRDFHDAVLGAGALPLEILEWRIEDWLAQRQATLAGGGS